MQYDTGTRQRKRRAEKQNQKAIRGSEASGLQSLSFLSLSGFCIQQGLILNFVDI